MGSSRFCGEGGPCSLKPKPTPCSKILILMMKVIVAARSSRSSWRSSGSCRSKYSFIALTSLIP